MKAFLRTFLLAGIIGGVFWAFSFGWGNGPSYAVWSGLIAGIVIGLLAGMIDRYRENRVAISSPGLADEVVLLDGRARHEGMAGWLYLTNRRLLFEGYPTDESSPEVSTLFDRFPSDATDKHLVSMPILQVSEVVPRSLGIDSRIDVVLTDGRTLYFGTEETTEWVDEISTARQRYLDEPQSEDRKLFR